MRMVCLVDSRRVNVKRKANVERKGNGDVDRAVGDLRMLCVVLSDSNVERKERKANKKRKERKVNVKRKRKRKGNVEDSRIVVLVETMDAVVSNSRVVRLVENTVKVKRRSVKREVNVKRKANMERKRKRNVEKGNLDVDPVVEDLRILCLAKIIDVVLLDSRMT